jgi:F-type H+-transporting ATPase subunit epsilon
MKLSVFTPAGVLLEEKAASISAEGSGGCFTLLPRHIDFATDIVPCVLSYISPKGAETFLAVDQGVLVKVGSQVSASVRAAVRSDDLASLADTVRERYRVESEEERKLRSAMADVEAGMVRRFMEIDNA